MNTVNLNVVVYGGNGFVGSEVAQQLQAGGANVSCVSRRGAKPKHLHDSEWARSVTWLTGDASKPDASLLARMDVLISVVGSPPLPTFSQPAYQRKVATNGDNNRILIEAAAQAGIKRVILLGAKIPSLLDADWFAYAKGKQISLQAAKEFSQRSAQHSAVVLQPGAIYGVRHSANGYPIPINLVLRPISKAFPSQLISVDQVAKCIVKHTLERTSEQSGFLLVAHAALRG